MTIPRRASCWLEALIPSETSAPILSGKTALPKAGKPRPARSARTPAPPGTRQNARSQVELGMWRGQAWRGRSGQAFGLGELGVMMHGTTANSLAASYHGPPGSPGRQSKAPRKELLAGPGPGPGANAMPLTNEPAA
jgi:hypothetical protein